MAWRILLDSQRDSVGYRDALTAVIGERDQLYDLKEGDPVIDQMLDILYLVRSSPRTIHFRACTDSWDRFVRRSYRQ